jgi:hypothetical protein
LAIWVLCICTFEYCCYFPIFDNFLTFTFWTLHFPQPILPIYYNHLFLPDQCPNEWYKDEEKVGSVRSDDASIFLELVKDSRFAEAGALIEDITQIPTADSLVVSKQVSPKDPTADIFLKVSKIHIHEKGTVETREVLSGVVLVKEYGILHRSRTS